VPPTATAVQFPSATTNAGVATDVALGAVNPAGIVKVGLSAAAEIPFAPTVKMMVKVFEVATVTAPGLTDAVPCPDVLGVATVNTPFPVETKNVLLMKVGAGEALVPP
jgi:hypothetical protein